MFFIKKKKPVRSLTERIVWGKIFGFLIGAIAFLSLPALSPQMNLLTGFGIWLWYTMFGAVIAFMGIYREHPILGLPMPALLRGALVGAGLNLVLALLIYDDISTAFEFMSGTYVAITGAPVFLLMVEGAVWGMILDFVLTKWLGEGKDLVKKL